MHRGQNVFCDRRVCETQPMKNQKLHVTRNKDELTLAEWHCDEDLASQQAIMHSAYVPLSACDNQGQRNATLSFT